MVVPSEKKQPNKQKKPRGIRNQNWDSHMHSLPRVHVPFPQLFSFLCSLATSVLGVFHFR